jgi:membrane protein implicated in regulation of membrane protease activity
MQDSDLIGVKATLVVLALLACMVGAFFIGPVVGVVVSLCAVSLALYLGYRAIQREETQDQ